MFAKSVPYLYPSEKGKFCWKHSRFLKMFVMSYMTLWRIGAIFFSKTIDIENKWLECEILVQWRKIFLKSWEAAMILRISTKNESWRFGALAPKFFKKIQCDIGALAQWRCPQQKISKYHSFPPPRKNGHFYADQVSRLMIFLLILPYSLVRDE